MAKTLHLEFFENFTSLCTKEAYQTDIKQFVDFLEAHCETDDLNKATREHVINYRNMLTDATDGKTPAAPKTVGRKLAALSSYFDYLVEKGERDFNPVTSVKRPRKDVMKPTQALTREQVVSFLEAIDTTNLSGKMHMALLTTFFTTGLRKSEVTNLRFANFREINDYWVLEYKGKGGKIGQKLLHPQAVAAIHDYLQGMKDIDRAHSDNDFLFQPTKNPANSALTNKALNPKTVNEIIANYTKKAGLNVHLTAHSARATFITELLTIGVDIYSVAKEVNHSSVVTTGEYDKRRRKILESPVTKLNFNKAS